METKQEPTNNVSSTNSKSVTRNQEKEIKKKNQNTRMSSRGRAGRAERGRFPGRSHYTESERKKTL